MTAQHKSKSDDEPRLAAPQGVRAGIKRFLVFTALFPPLVMVFAVPDLVFHPETPALAFLLWMLGYAYLIAVVPAWVTAAVDWTLSATPFYLRLVVTAVVAATLALLVARFLGERDDVLYLGLIGAIPAAVCSLLSNVPIRR